MFQLRKNNNDLLRIICLIKNKIAQEVEIQTKTISILFPSIWSKVLEKGQKPVTVGGFYREWSKDGKLTIEEQVTSIEVFTKPIKDLHTNVETNLIISVNLLKRNKLYFTLLTLL